MTVYLLEKRKHPRRMSFNVQAKAVLGEEQFDCGVVKLSAKGAVLLTHSSVPPWTPLKILIELPGPSENTIEVQGVVTQEAQTEGGIVWCIQFEHIDARQEVILKKYLSRTKKPTEVIEEFENEEDILIIE